MTEKNDKLKNIDPEVMKAIRDDVLRELRDEEEKKKALEAKQREEEEKRRGEYVERMKDSNTPWVELMGITEKDGRIKVQLEWNDAFVKQLREAGYNGSEDRVMTQYIAELAYDVSEDMKGNLTTDVGEEVSE